MFDHQAIIEDHNASRQLEGDSCFSDRKAYHSEVSSMNVLSLRNYCRYIQHEYENFLLQHAEEEQVLNQLEGRLCRTIAALEEQEKETTRERSHQVQHLDGLWQQQDDLKRRKSSLEEQLCILEQIKDINSSKVEELKEETAYLRNECSQEQVLQQLGKGSLLMSKQCLEDTKQQILAVMQNIDNQRAYKDKQEDRMDQEDRSNENLRNKIGGLHEQWDIQAQQIQKCLQRQSKQVEKYEDIKNKQIEMARNKQLIEDKIAKEQKEYQKRNEQRVVLEEAIHDSQAELQLEKDQIGFLGFRNMRDRQSILTNKNTLEQLRSYLVDLLQQNKKVEQLIQQHIVQDLQLQCIFERKHCLPQASKFLKSEGIETLPKESGNNSSSFCVKFFDSSCNKFAQTATSQQFYKQVDLCLGLDD